MAVGIRANARTGSYGAGQNASLELGRVAQPDFFGGRQGTVYIDYRATDEANGYKFDKNGKVFGSGRNGYETKAEQAKRMADREKSMRTFTNAVRGSANANQYKNNNKASYDKAYNKALNALAKKNGGRVTKAIERKAAVTARRTVNQREQERLRTAAKKAGVGIKKVTQR